MPPSLCIPADVGQAAVCMWPQRSAEVSPDRRRLRGRRKILEHIVDIGDLKQGLSTSHEGRR